MKTKTTMIAGFIALTLSADAGAATIYVDHAATGQHNGQSWDDAYLVLQAALEAAVPGDEIWVALGVYYPDGKDAGTSYALKQGVTVLGGFEGDETLAVQRTVDPDPAIADPATDTILSGEIAPPGVIGNATNIIKAHGINSTAVLDGFTITGGGAGDGGGAGLSCVNASPRIRNCNFISNAAGSGGGMLIDGGAPQVLNCFFRSNAAFTDRGGAAYVFRNASPVFIGCTFDDNDAAVGGGALCFVGATGSLTNCSFNSNSSGGEGGAVELVLSSPSLTGCTFSENLADINNGASGGGAIWAFTSSPVISRCSFAFNAATQGGAVFASQNSTVTLVNALLVANASLVGGAGFSANSSLALVNCTVVMNDDASDLAGAVYGPSAITNCILRNDAAEATSAAITRSNVEGGAAGTGNFDSDPMFVGESAGNFALQAASPCIDAGDNTAVPGAAALDLAGMPRFRNIVAVPDTGVGPGPIVDIGAYEVQPPPCPADLNSDGLVDTADLVQFLGAFGTSVPAGTGGDLNNDGFVNTADLARFLSAFGSACL